MIAAAAASNSAGAGLLSNPGEVLGVIAILAAAVIVLFSTRSKQTKADLQASVVALQGEDQVNKSKIARLEEQDRSRLRELEQANKRIEELGAAVHTLSRVVTGVDVVIEGFVLAAEAQDPARGREVRRRLDLVRSESERGTAPG